MELIPSIFSLTWSIHEEKYQASTEYSVLVFAQKELRWDTMTFEALKSAKDGNVSTNSYNPDSYQMKKIF